MKRSLLSVCLIVGLLFVCALLSLANDKQDQADALIARSRQLSDIRAPGSPAFHLKASVKLYSDKGRPTEGTYDEYWVSKAQWRSEVAIGDFHHIEVDVGDKRWTSDSTQDFPDDVLRPQSALLVWTANPERWKVGSIHDKDEGGRVLSCMETKSDALYRRRQCFDETTSLLILTLSPRPLMHGIVIRTCEYSDYQKYGDKMIAKQVRCLDDGKVRMELRVLELDALTNPHADLFQRPNNAKETTNCLGITKPPVANYTPPSSAVTGALSLRLTVGKDGRPKDIEVVRHGDESSDELAMASVRLWMFKPATCDGQPVEAQITVDVGSSAF